LGGGGGEGGRLGSQQPFVKRGGEGNYASVGGEKRGRKKRDGREAESASEEKILLTKGKREKKGGKGRVTAGCSKVELSSKIKKKKKRV